MSGLGQKLRVATGTDGVHLVYWCQGCEDTHQVRVGEGSSPRWTWDGNPVAPTFEPSVLVKSGHFVDGWQEGDPCWCPRYDPEWQEGWPTCVRCHTFVTGGMVRFLEDCSHALAGQTLPLADWPYADGEYGGVERLP